MSKILKNDSGSNQTISDTGVSISDTTQYTIPPQDYLLWAASDDVITLIGNGDLVVNDGSTDLGISDGINLIKGIFPSKVGINGGTNNTQIGNVGDRLKTDSNLTLDDNSLGDAFGRLRTSSPLIVFDAYFAETDKSLLFSEKTVGSGSISRDNDSACMGLQVSASDGDRAVRQTKQYIHYIPGQSYTILQTATLNEQKDNLIQRIGFFDDNDGLFFEASDDDLHFTIRNSSTGSVVDTKISRSNWNGDKLDGTGDSGITLDITKDNIFVLDFQWLGAGKVRFGFSLNGNFVVCHSVDNANNNTLSYIRQGSLPIRQEILNDGISLDNSSRKIRSFCMAAISEGNNDIFTQQVTVDTNGTVSINTSSYNPILAVRLKSSTNRGQLIIAIIKALATTNDDILIRTYYNPTISGGTWVSAGNESITEYNDSMTSFSGGYHVGGDLIAKAGGGPSSISEVKLTINSDIDGTSDTFLITAKSLTSSANLAAVLTIKELF